MMTNIRTLTALLGLGLATTLASAVGRPPPPTNVTVSDVQGVDKKSGSFTLEWTPAFDPSGRPYSKYDLSGGCKYEPMDSGVQVGPTGISGLWLVSSPGPRYRLKATCSCVYAPNRNSSVATAGWDAYTPRSAWVNTNKFQVPCGS